jgi:hypothetical protein
MFALVDPSSSLSMDITHKFAEISELSKFAFTFKGDIIEPELWNKLLSQDVLLSIDWNVFVLFHGGRHDNAGATGSADLCDPDEEDPTIPILTYRVYTNNAVKAV